MLGAATIVFKRKHHTAPGKQKNSFQKPTSGTTIFFWENFLPVTNFYTFDLQRVKNIFGKLYASEEVVKGNIW